MSETRATHRWRGVVAVVLFAGAAGVILKRPALLLLATSAVGFAAYPRLTSQPTPALELERVVADDDPDHGDVVTVTVTVHNAGDGTLSDVRVLDGVPPMLAVADGTPRHATVLRPGGSATFSYAVTAKRGSHRFDPATVVARDLAGASEVETRVSTETQIECHDGVPDAPLRSRTGERVGHLVTDEGGSGIEFHRTRDYRRGDALSRIDWKRFARTGDLATVEYREERSTSVLLCLDARAVAYRTSEDGEPHAVSYGLGALEQLFATVLDTPNRVGIGTFGPGGCWLSPGSGAEHAVRGRELLSTHPSLSASPPGEETSGTDLDVRVREFQSRLGTDAQVVLFSPLLDDDVVQACLQLEVEGYAVTVVSPDVTTTATPGSRIATVERERRLSTLRNHDVRVVDWTPSEPIGTALVTAQEAWSA